MKQTQSAQRISGCYVSIFNRCDVAVVHTGIGRCVVPSMYDNNYNIYQLSIQYVAGMMLPYVMIAVLNALIIIQMANYRRLRAGMSANVDTKSDDSAQR